MKVCKFDGCDRKARSRGMCNAHYMRWTNLGRLSNWDGGPPIGAVVPKPQAEVVDWEAVLQRMERRAGPRTAALARMELQNLRQRRAQAEAQP